MAETQGVLGNMPCGANDEDLAPYRAMTRDELERHAFVITGQLNAVIDTAQHWRISSERLASDGYIAPFRYTLPELAMTIREAIFWANWPATEHRDIFNATDAERVTSDG